ncbi:MAG: hypothetical protein ABIO24_02250, partial [Saprospiraceae bacterium]
MQKQELIEQIEAYLSGKLSPEEQSAWEQRLADEPELRKTVEFHRNLLQDYDAGRLQLRANMLAVMREPLPPEPAPGAANKWRWGLWIGLFAAGILLVWRFWPAQNTAPILPEALPRELPGPSAAPEPKPTPAPIAQADPARFAANPGLEALVKSSIRGESIAVQWEQPVNGRRFIPDKKGAVLVRFQGRLQWPGDRKPAGFSLLVFGNKNTNTPLHQVPLNLPADAQRLDFDLRQRLKL